MEYNPQKFWKENTIESIFADLEKQKAAEDKWKKDTGWKPDFMISAGYAKKINLSELKYLSENYRLIGGREACQAVRQRQIIINYNG